MVSLRHNAMTLQTLWRSREPVLVLRQVLVSGPITALAAVSPRRKVNIFGRCTSGPWGGRKEGLQGRNGSVNPLALRPRGTIISPWPFWLQTSGWRDGSCWTTTPRPWRCHWPTCSSCGWDLSSWGTASRCPAGPCWWSTTWSSPCSPSTCSMR